MSNRPDEPREPTKPTVIVAEDIPPEMLPTPLVESDIMLDPWVELPEPPADCVTTATLGELPLPDPPDIPEDWDQL